MDIIDKAFSKLHKEQAPAQLRARVLDVPQAASQAKQPWGHWFRRFAPALALLAIVLGGIYFQYFRISNFAAAFELTAEMSDAAGIKPESPFILKSSKSLSSAQVKKIVRFSPETDFDVQGLGDNRYRLTPKANLNADQVYTVSIDEGAGDRDYSWAYQVKAEFQVIGTLPGNQTSQAPINTGIEITFNRERFVNPEQYVVISPGIEGSFEQFGSTLIFKPKNPLKDGTLYTVTVRQGLGIEGSSDTLSSDYTFKFEVEDRGRYSYNLSFANDFGQSASDRPVFQTYSYGVDQSRISASVYKFTNGDTYVRHYEQSRDWENSWAAYAGQAHKQTVTAEQGARIAQFKPTFTSQDYSTFVEIPDRLDNGFYVLELSTPDNVYAYQWFQVTPYAHYSAQSHAKSLVWLYDFPSKRPVSGATVRMSGEALGQTSGDGLLEYQTPQSVLESAEQTPSYLNFYRTPNIVSIAVPGGQPYFFRQSFFNYYYAGNPLDEGNRYWEHLSTDRPIYQPSDVVNFWGVVQGRQGVETPKNVTASLYTDYYYYGSDVSQKKPLITTQAAVSNYGSYQGNLSFAGLTPGYYSLVVSDGNKTVSTAYVQVLAYSKPAYQITVETPRSNYYAGESIDYTVKAAFYDGTPVANMELSYTGYWNNQELRGTLRTGANGVGKVSLSVPYYEQANMPSYYYDYWPKGFNLEVRPVKSEEGEIAINKYVNIFGPRISMRVDQKVNDDRSNTFTAHVNETDISEDLQAQARQGSPYQGKPAVGQTVQATITKITYTRRETGQYYDYVNKVTIPTYTYDRGEQLMETVSGTTDQDGTWTLSKQYPKEENVSYEILFIARDSSGRPVRSFMSYSHYDYSYPYYNYSSSLQASRSLQPVLEFADKQYSHEFSVGDKVQLDLSFQNPNVEWETGKVLYYEYGKNLGKAVISSDQHFEDTFNNEYKPSVSYRAVVLGPYGFEVASPVTASFKLKDAELSIEISADKGGYRPGETAKVSVMVKDQSGNPVSADVNLAVVDESLFSVGYSNQTNILYNLYKYISREPLESYTRYDAIDEGGGRGGGGGDEGAARVLFQDTALFSTVHTGRDGKAEASVKLPDNITSWRITAQAFEAESIRGGAAIENIQSGLPLFVDATMAGTFLAGDEPVVKLRAFGTGYRQDQPASVKVQSAGLALDSTQTMANGLAYVTLPKLREGVYEISMEVSQGDLRDKLVRKIVVTNSYFSKPEVQTYTLSEGLSVQGSRDGMTRVVFTDAGKGQYFGTLSGYSYMGGVRLDQRVVSYYAQSTLQSTFGSGSKPDPIDFSPYLKNNGLAQFTYGEADLALSAQTAALLGTNAPADKLRAYFTASLSDRKSDIHRTAKALYGMAALKQPVLVKLNLIKDEPDLTLEDRMYLASALASLGDTENARRYYFDTIQKNLVIQGDEAFVDLPDAGSDKSSQDTVVTQEIKLTSMAAVVQSQLQLSEDLAKTWNYINRNWPVKDANYLEKALVIKYALVHTDGMEGKFTYETNANRGTITLEKGQSHTMEFLPGELQSLRFTNVSGSIRVFSLYEAPAQPEAANNAGISLTRTYSVGGKTTTSFKDGDVVKVTLTLGRSAGSNKSYQVTDFLPSGLRSLTPAYTVDPYAYYTPNYCERSYWYPDVVTQNRISFSVYNDPGYGCTGRPVSIVYYARVVNAGTFRADPAIISPSNDLSSITTSAPETLTIGR